MPGTATAANVRLPTLAASTSSTVVPSITAGQTPEYAKGLEELTSRAFLNEPLTIAFATERLKATSITPADVASGHAVRIAHKLSLGAEIVEAGNWAAAACWEPPEVNQRPTVVSAEMKCSRPVFVGFIEQIQAAKKKYLPVGQRHWHLSMMARDPGRKDKGAVRAVLVPYIERAKQEDLPIWIEAGSPRARDVYAYFGFRILEEIWSGVGKVASSGYPMPGGPGVPTWLMIKDPLD